MYHVSTSVKPDGCSILSHSTLYSLWVFESMTNGMMLTIKTPVQGKEIRNV
jgi:hypothetical protein